MQIKEHTYKDKTVKKELKGFEIKKYNLKIKVFKRTVTTMWFKYKRTDVNTYYDFHVYKKGRKTRITAFTESGTRKEAEMRVRKKIKKALSKK